MATFLRCAHCRGQYDVTGCPPGTRFLCHDCGEAVLVPGDDEPEATAGQAPCPTCGRPTPREGRARCLHCASPLGVATRTGSTPDEVLECGRCATRYDVSRYGPGTRFRCRTCGTEMRLPMRGRWLGTGEWELDPATGALHCNGCGGHYNLGGRTADAAFVCQRCRRVYMLPPIQPAAPRGQGAGGEQWELDVDAGLVRCHGCGYSYDVSLWAGEHDFTCPRCRTVFRMPQILTRDGGGHAGEREIILCNRCGSIHDVSDYPRGTLFSCDGCGTVLQVSGVPGEWEVDTDAEALVCSACGHHHPLKELAEGPGITACRKCRNPFRFSMPARAPAAPTPDAGPAAAATAAAAPATAPTPAPGSPERAPGEAEASRRAPGTKNAPRVTPSAPPAPAPAPAEPVARRKRSDRLPRAGADAPARNELRCGRCGSRYDVTNRKPGARIRCRKCRGVLVVPGGAPPATAPAPAAAPAKKPAAKASAPAPTKAPDLRIPASVREGRAVLLECHTCHVAYEVPIALASARLRCKTCRSPVVRRPPPEPDLFTAGHEVEVLRGGAARRGKR